VVLLLNDINKPVIQKVKYIGTPTIMGELTMEARNHENPTIQRNNANPRNPRDLILPKGLDVNNNRIKLHIP
jgi:hypothetical protein